MTTKMSGGLLPAPSRLDMAANEDGLGPRTVAPAGRQDSEDQGWDPFEVWRTRVKEAREQTSAPAPSGRGDRRKN
jgi:hypothetical protein